MRIWTTAIACVLVGACAEDVPVEEPTPLTDLGTVFEYPVELWDRGVDGQTILMVHVTDMGRVDTTYVARSSGFEAFDSAALAGVREVRFSPARRGETRVPMWVRLPVRFSHDGKTLGQPAGDAGGM